MVFMLTKVIVFLLTKFFINKLVNMVRVNTNPNLTSIIMLYNNAYYGSNF